MAAYYNEFDPNAAAWLRELIKRGLIADGEVDTRSIEDVAPDDLRHFTQCHFFAGIGGWSVALRLAGWRDDQPVWTGSCPCQPFSSAGKGGGFADERHLWPAFFHLIGQCRPAVVFGEQVASKDGLAWLDLVHADLEAARYAVGAADLCAAGIGAPHIRQRLFWVADADGGHTSAERQQRSGQQRQQSQDGGACSVAHDHGGGRGRHGEARLHERRPGAGSEEPQARDADGALGHDAAGRGADGVVGHTVGARLEGHGRDQAARGHGQGAAGSVASAGSACGMGNTDSERVRGRPAEVHRPEAGEGGRRRGDDAVASGSADFWTPADWLPCRDGKWRPVEPGTFPLAHGLPARVGRLRGYGNAIVPQVAATFIEAYLDTTLA